MRAKELQDIQSELVEALGAVMNDSPAKPVEELSLEECKRIGEANLRTIAECNDKQTCPYNKTATEIRALKGVHSAHFVKGNLHIDCESSVLDQVRQILKANNFRWNSEDRLSIDQLKALAKDPRDS